jgi:hypothetical protein
MVAGGAVADATLTAVNRSGYSAGASGALVGGVVVGLIGLVLLALGWKPDTRTPEGR